MILPKTIRDKAIELRERKQLNQDTLAKMAGVSQSTVCSMERGRTGVSEENTWKILAALDLLEEGWKTLQATKPWGEWLTPWQAAQLMDTTAPKVMSHAYHEKITGAHLTQEGNWWIPAYHLQDPRQRVAIDLVHGTGNQYNTLAVPDKRDEQPHHYTKEFFLHQGVVVIHVEKGSAPKYEWSIEVKEEDSWRTIREETLEESSDSSVHIMTVSQHQDANTTPGAHRFQVKYLDDSQITWTQPAPDSGWFELGNNQEQSMTEAGLWLFGPCLPTQRETTAHIRTDQEANIQIEAFATDGSHTRTVYDGQASPTPLTVNTGLDPQKEYVLVVAAKSDWHIDWTEHDPEIKPDTETTQCK